MDIETKTKILTNCRKRLTKLDTTRGVVERSRVVRTLYLYLIRMFSLMTKYPIYSKLLYLAYRQNPSLNDSIDNFEQERNTLHPYIRLVRGTLYRYKMLCERNTLSQYSSLPGWIPLDLRTHIVSYASILPIGLA